MSQTVLVFGAGVGGLVAANVLRRRLPARHRINIVDREPSFSLAASYLWVMSGARRPGQISRPFDGHGACFVEVGQGKAGYGAGNFYAEPRPAVTPHRPNRWWHAGKALFEKYWFWWWL